MSRAPFPLVESIGIARHPDGWVVVSLQSRGEEIIDADIVQRPGSLKVAIAAAYSAMVALAAKLEKDGGAGYAN